MWIKLRKNYINLREAARISGYSSDYIGYLIRIGKIEGKRVYLNTSWRISPKEIIKYCQRNNLDIRYCPFLKKKGLSLKETAQILGYTPDYIGYLIRKGRILGKKVYSGPAWLTTEKAIKKYQEKSILRRGSGLTLSEVEVSIIKNKKPIIGSIREQPIARLVYDIFPPEKIRKAAREITGWKPYQTKWEKIFALGWRLVLVVAILFLLIGIGPTEILQKITGAFTEGEKTINLYPAFSGGENVEILWQNPQNVIGLPDVGPDGDFNSFSEANSAVYQGGSSNLILSKFIKTETDLAIETEKQKTESTPPLEEEKPVLEEPVLEIPPIESTTPAIESVSQPQEGIKEEEVPKGEPTSFFEKVKSFFGNFKTQAQEIPTFEELKNTQFQSAKIKFSFAIGEKKTEFTPLLETPSPEETPPEIPPLESVSPSEEGITPGEAAIENTTPNEEGLVQPPQETETRPEKQEEMPTQPEETPQEESSPTSFWQKVKNFFGTLTINAQEETSPIETVTPQQEGIVEPTGTAENGSPPIETTTPPTEGVQEILPNLDAKIIVWYSLDGTDWQKLDEISNSPLSNFLNGGYFSYDAPFLKNWDDVKNLKIKFEGVVGGETNFVAYLDSVWVEASYAEQKEEKPEEPKKLLKIKIKDNSLVMPQLENSFSVNEEPTFLIEEPELSVEELIKTEKGEIIGEMQGSQTPETEKTPLENLKEKILEPIIDLVTPKVGAQTKNIKTKIFGPDGIEISILPTTNFTFRNNKEVFEIKIPKPNDREIRPGLYKLEIEFETKDAIYVLEQDFTWGVLAININKSIYLPSETAYIQMAALRDDGYTICDANLKLEVISPSGSTAYPEIQKSEECAPRSVTQKPDYFAYYEIGEAGEYKMKLTNLDSNYEITDSFEVRDSVPFDIERIGPTRIYPPAIYEMKFRIKANQDFEGFVEEKVPSDFIIESNQSEEEGILGFNILKINPDNYFENPNVLPGLNIDKFNNSEFEVIQWRVKFQKDEIYELSYQFDAPDISPYLYLLGPLEIYVNPSTSSGRPDFSEIRSWQIAADRTTWTESCGTATKAGCTCAKPAYVCGGTPACTYTCPARTNATVTNTCSYTYSGNCGTDACSIPTDCRVNFTCSFSSGNCSYTCTTGWEDCNQVTSDGCECNTGGGYICVGTTCTLSGITISGTIYTDEGTTAYNCSTDNLTVAVRVNGAGTYSTLCTASGGTYSISGVSISAANDVVTVFLDGETPDAVTVTRAADTTSAISGLDLYQNRLIVRHEGATSITNTNLAQYDKDQDTDIFFDSDLSTTYDLTVDSGKKIVVWTAKTFAPGGNVTTPAMRIMGTSATYSAGSSTLTLNGTGTNTTCTNDAGTVMPLCLDSGGVFTASTSTTTFSGDGDIYIAATTYNILNLTPTITATREYTAAGAITVNSNLTINPSAASLNILNFDLGGTTTVTGTTNVTSTSSAGSALKTLNYSFTTGNLTIADNQWVEMLCGSSTVTVTNSGTPFSLGATSTWLPSTSTFVYTGTSATNITGTTYYNLNIGGAATNTTYTAAGDITVTNILTIVSSSGTNTFSASSYTITLSGTGTPFVINATEVFTASISTVNYTGTAATTVTGTTYYNLGVGTTADAAAVTYTLGGATTVTNILTVGNAGSTATDTLAGSSYTLTLSGPGTPFVLTAYYGTFSADTSTVNYTATAATNVTATTYYNLGVGTTIDSTAVTYSLLGTTIVNNALSIGNAGSTGNDTLDTTGTNYALTAASINITSKGILTANGSTITITGSGTPFTISGTFNYNTSTIKYTGNGDTNITAATYNNLEFSPTITANRVYTGAGAITAGGALNINPTASSTLSLTFNLGGTTSVTGLTTIQRTTSATSILDTVSGSNYTFNTGSLTIKAGGTLNGRASALDSNGDITIEASGTLTSTSGNFNVGGNWSNSGTFTHSSGTVTFDASSGDKTISDGGSCFYNIVFNGGASWTYQDSGCSDGPNQTTVQAGTVLYLNTKTGTVSVTGGTFNVDWYLGIHVVDAATLENIDTGDNDITISENSATPASTVWRHNGTDWGTAASSQTTGTDTTGRNPQPNSAGAMRIREYAKTSTTTTYYLYNLQIAWQSTYGEYDYYADYGNKYLTSTGNTGSGHDEVISVGWYRSTPGTMNTPYVSVNEPPTNGSWYCGMLKGLEVTITGTSIDFGTLDTSNNFTATAGTQTQITVTTSATSGYIVTAWESQLMTCSAANCGVETTIQNLSDTVCPYSNPCPWTTLCKDDPNYCGFGFTSNDPLVEGVNRYNNATEYTYFPTTSANPVRVMDYSSPIYNNSYLITYRISAPVTQRPGPYQTTIVYVITAQY